MDLPSPETLRLKDGRLLEYAVYGAGGGLPAVFFHGFIGSHHQAAFAHEAARRHGVRLIAPSRPGVGRSTPAPRRAIRECLEDVRQLADALGVASFAVIGASGGAPYALACLAGLPARARLGVLLSGLGPVGEPGLLAAMSPLARQALRLGRRLPWLASGLLALRARHFRRDPEAFLDALMRRWPGPDRELFESPLLRRLFLADLSAVLAHGEGVRGLARELGLYFRWGFRLEELPPGIRLLLWHGRHDPLVPASMAEHVAGLVPGAELILRPGGHFMAVGHAEEIIERTKAALAGPGWSFPPPTT
jgi:pimeloyl-ACP methyl ester carboxylesterase